jgi:hypothetical protein
MSLSLSVNRSLTANVGDSKFHLSVAQNEVGSIQPTDSRRGIWIGAAFRVAIPDEKGPVALRPAACTTSDII